MFFAIERIFDRVIFEAHPVDRSTSCSPNLLPCYHIFPNGLCLTFESILHLEIIDKLHISLLSILGCDLGINELLPRAALCFFLHNKRRKCQRAELEAT